VAIGGIYIGIFTPTEGAAVGAVSTGALAFLQGKLDWREFREAILGAGQTTAMVFLILIGAELYSAFLARTGLPFEAAELIAGANVAPVVVILLMLAVYLVMGCVMDSLAMILLTVPVFHPIVIGLDLGLTPEEASIWFGIIILIVVEVALITPPFGLNVFIINGMSKDVPLLETFKGVMPFIAADVVRVALLVAFPAIALWLTWI
jgi:TRAP-type C4-dicarboxylate transport system permease large subunit